VIHDEALFEAVANNRHLPDDYQQAMVLRPGAQGESEIMGEWYRPEPHSHVFEYLRRNSYIPWGHYAANMANDAVRYRVQDLTGQDMAGMRHLYYQRSYTRMAGLMNLRPAGEGRSLTQAELETLRQQIIGKINRGQQVDFDRTLWGWNYGFDYAPTGYRLHASHQQIHQQYAMIPSTVRLAKGDGNLPAYACGDLIGDVVKIFRRETGCGFFECYQKAIGKNQRMDGDTAAEKSLVVFEDDEVLLFVPKAQTSQWELQLMPKTQVGNIFEANAMLRRALDRAILIAVKTLGAMGARMITSIEYNKAIVGGDADQRLLMAFMPRLPESPGAFSEAQLRFINGHYPEDFASVCRHHVPETDAG
jgi:diadenosine tetraphosphate (Ap4A) HIT family hydrolase